MAFNFPTTTADRKNLDRIHYLERVAGLAPSSSIRAIRQETFPVWMGTLLSVRQFDLNQRVITNAMVLNPNVRPSAMRRPRNPFSPVDGFPTEAELRFAAEALAEELAAIEEVYPQTIVGVAVDMFADLLRTVFPNGGEPLERFLGNLDVVYERENVNMGEFRRVYMRPEPAGEPAAPEPAPAAAAAPPATQNNLAQSFPNIPARFFDPNSRANRDFRRGR